MAKPISKKQIQDAERDFEALVQSDGDFQQKVRDGKIKFTVIPGDTKSILKRVDLTNPDQVKAYGGGSLFNTPQEAEHFTVGFGHQPTREGNAIDIVRRAVMPRYQHQIYDPVRKYNQDPAKDAVADAMTNTRYAVPFISILGLPEKAAQLAGFGGNTLTKLPTGLGTAGINMALGLGANAVAGDKNLEETLPNIVANAAAGAASVAANKYFMEEKVRERQLKDQLRRKLGYDKEGFIKRMLGKDKFAVENPTIMQDAVTTLEGGNPYTLGDWRDKPLHSFDIENDAKNAKVKIKAPAWPREPSATPGQTKSTILKKGVTHKFTEQEWDAIARRFMADNPALANADIEDVRKFIKTAWERPQSDFGMDFFGPKELEKTEWVKRKATTGNLDKGNEAAAILYRENAVFEDPALNEAYNKAMAEYKNRLNRLKTSTRKVKLVSPEDYHDMGDYKVRTPVDLGKQKLKIGTRGAIRLGATLLPLAVQAVGPYVYKAVAED